MILEGSKVLFHAKKCVGLVLNTIETPASGLRAVEDEDERKGGKGGEVLVVVVLVRKLKPSSGRRMQQLRQRQLHMSALCLYYLEQNCSLSRFYSWLPPSNGILDRLIEKIVDLILRGF